GPVVEATRHRDVGIGHRHGPARRRRLTYVWRHGGGGTRTALVHDTEVRINRVNPDRHRHNGLLLWLCMYRHECGPACVPHRTGPDQVVWSQSEPARCAPRRQEDEEYPRRGTDVSPAVGRGNEVRGRPAWTRVPHDREPVFIAAIALAVQVAVGLRNI